MMGGFFLGAGAVSAVALDTVAPSVSSVSIEDDETDGTFVRVTFGEDIDPDSLVFGNISLTVNAVGRGISTPTWPSASALEFVTDSPVYEGETCLLTVAAGAVEDLAGNANALQSGIAVTNNSTRTLASDLIAKAGSSLFELHLASSVTTNGSGRFRWTDLGPSGRHWDSPSAGADPVVEASTDLGGLPAVRTDGATDYLVSTAAASAYNALSNGTECAILSLVEKLTPGVFQGFLGNANSNAQTGFYLYFNTNETAGVNVYNGTTNVASTAAADSMTGRIVETRIDSSARIIAGNSGKIGAKTTINSPGATASQTLTFGRRPGLSQAYCNARTAAVVILVKGAESSAEFDARVVAVRGVLTRAAFAADPINLICLGNSLTTGVGASDETLYSYPAQLNALAAGKAVVSKQGYNGLETPELNDAEATTAAATAKRANNCMILWEGGNHIHQSLDHSVTSSVALAAYVTLTGILRTNGYQGLILGPTITNRTSFDATNLIDVAAFNAAIIADPGDYGLDGTIDLASIGTLDPPADDGTHFDDAQYGIIAAAVWADVEPRFPSASA